MVLWVLPQICVGVPLIVVVGLDRFTARLVRGVVLIRVTVTMVLWALSRLLLLPPQGRKAA